MLCSSCSRPPESTRSCMCSRAVLDLLLSGDCGSARACCCSLQQQGLGYSTAGVIYCLGDHTPELCIGNCTANWGFAKNEHRFE